MIEPEVPTRSGTAAEWAAANAPVLGKGELGVNLDTGEVRIGDGTSAFSALPRRDGVKARGTTVLVTGTKVVTGLTGVVVGDIVVATVRALGTVTSAKALMAVAGAGQITITSADNTDTSTVQFAVYAA
jgi:hypothetical protein